jgi:integrase
MTNRLYLSLDENRGSGHAGLPKDGLLFPDIPPDRLGRRAGTATKRLGKWVRQKVGIIDRRFDPNHSWRHRFVSECREAGVDRETQDALTGHSDGTVSRNYGEFYIRTVFYPAIAKLVSPLDKTSLKGRAGDRDEAGRPLCAV